MDSSRLLARSIGWTSLAAACFTLACGSGGSGSTDPGTPTDDAIVGDVVPDMGSPSDVPEVSENGSEPDCACVDLGDFDPFAKDPGAEDPGVEDLGAGDPGPTDPGVPVDGTVMPDVSWTSLPRLPKDKMFATPYAAGVANRDITPDGVAYMGGFGFCGGDDKLCRKSEGVHDPLLARAAAIAHPATGEVVIFVGLDSVGLIRYDVDRIHERTQLALYEKHGVFFEGVRVIVASSHAHSSVDSVGMWGPMFGAGRDEVYIEMLRSQVVAAAVEAFDNLSDAHLDWWQGTSPNNDDDKETDDPHLFVLRAARPDGTPVFTMTRWPGHPTAFGGSNNGLSSDWIGAFRLRMEEAFGGMSIFLNGPIGSVYPNRDACTATDAFPDGWHDPDLSADNFMTVTCCGYRVADNAIAAAVTAQPVAETGIKARHTRFSFHPENGAFMLMAQAGPLPFQFVDVSDPDALMDSHFSWITIGDLDYLTTPGESFPTFAKRAADRIVAAGGQHPIVLGVAQDWMGYLLTVEQWLDDDLGYNQGLSPGTQVEPKFMEKLDELIKAE